MNTVIEILDMITDGDYPPEAELNDYKVADMFHCLQEIIEKHNEEIFELRSRVLLLEEKNMYLEQHAVLH
jgi:hypothetical protein